MKARIIAKKTVSTAAALVMALGSTGIMGAWADTSDAAYTADNTFTFTDTAVTADSEGSGYTIDGTTLTISESGTYVVTGNSSDGSIVIAKKTTGVTLVLSDLTLSADDTAPLVVKKNSEVNIVIENENTLTDLEDIADETSTDEAVADAFEGAAIKVKSGSAVTFSGTGTLTADGTACKNAIKGGETASIIVGESASDSFTIKAKAANTAFASDGSVTVNGGDLELTADGDGLKASPDEDDTESAGTITVNGGNIEVTSGDDAVKGAGDVTINGGSFTISSGDDGIHSDATLTINGGDINIIKSVEGLEGAGVNMNGGTGRVVSSDDGVNAANSDLTGYTYELNISGGSWYIDAEGDGLDSNGNLTVSGGFTEVFGPTTGGNGALDKGDGDYTFSITGGTLLATDLGDMAETPASGKYLVFGVSGGQGGQGMQPADQSQQTDGTTPPALPDGTDPAQGDGTEPPALPDGTQPSDGQQGFQPGGQGQQQGVSFTAVKGQSIVIKDSKGNEVYSGTAAKNLSHILFSADDLDSAETYTLYVDGTAVVNATVSEGQAQGQQSAPAADEGGSQEDSGSQDDSSSGDTTPAETKPEAPAKTAVTSFSCTQTAIRVNWKAIDGAAGYRVYRYDSTAGKYVRIADVSADTLTYRDSGLTAGTKYKYKVIAYAKNSAGITLGKASTPYTAATKAKQPTIKKTKSSKNAVRLYWSKVKCTGYKIQRYDSSTGSWKTVKIVSSKTTNAAVAGLSSGKTYKLRVVPFTRTSGKTVTGKVSLMVKAKTK